MQKGARADRAECGAYPEASVDAEVGATAVACRDQLLDRRIDRRVFAADAGAGHEAEQRECSEISGKRGCARGADVHPERYEEKALASKPVGEPTKQKGAQHGTGEVCARRKP